LEKLVMNFCMSQLRDCLNLSAALYLAKLRQAYGSRHLRGLSDALSAVAKMIQNFWQLGCCRGGQRLNAFAGSFGPILAVHGVMSDLLGYGLQNIWHSNVFLDDMKNHLQHHHNLQCCT
jgi:hypothetical protein